MKSTSMQAYGSDASPGEDAGIKVLAINASPHKNTGNTAQILGPFLEGMRDAGADVGLYYTRDLTVHACRGDIVCFCRKSGRCVQSDDMDWLVPKAREADILVFASPIYFDGVTGPMKVIIDRLVPFATMPFGIRDGHSRHVPRDEKVRKLVFVSSCGLWERDNFDPAVAHMKAVAGNMNAEYAGGLIRPHARFLKSVADTGFPTDAVFRAARQAGRELVLTGKMPGELLDEVSRDLVTRDQFMAYMDREVTGLCGRLGRED